MTSDYSRWLLLLFFATLFVLLSGCNNTNTITDPNDEEQPFVLPTSADAMVLAYQDAWRTKDFTEYRALLATDFKFVLAPPIARDFHWGSDHVSRVDDLAMAESIFNTVSAISMVIQPRDDWVAEDLGNEHFAGILRREYEVHAEVHDPTTGVTYIVDGDIVFYATSLDVDVDGEQVTHWYLAGQHDMWIDKRVETCSLSLIKMLWR